MRDGKFEASDFADVRFHRFDDNITRGRFAIRINKLLEDDMRECVTHHHACDCREQKFKALEIENNQLTYERDLAVAKCTRAENERDALQLQLTTYRAKEIQK